MREAPNGPFYIFTPKPSDTRERNAFGILKGFGEAYDSYPLKPTTRRLIESFRYRRQFTPRSRRKWIADAMRAQRAHDKHFAREAELDARNYREQRAKLSR